VLSLIGRAAEGAAGEFGAEFDAVAPGGVVEAVAGVAEELEGELGDGAFALLVEEEGGGLAVDVGDLDDFVGVTEAAFDEFEEAFAEIDFGAGSPRRCRCSNRRRSGRG
jgi:hypothetical protein